MFLTPWFVPYILIRFTRVQKAAGALWAVTTALGNTRHSRQKKYRLLWSIRSLAKIWAHDMNGVLIISI